MMNMGPRPTFGDAAISIEVHLFDADVDLYGADVKVNFVARLRDVMRFSGPDALAAQLRRDEEHARRALTLAGYSSNLQSSPRSTIPLPQS
jgi:riboflavin kinase/FMN adenylyltransferase